MGFFGNIFGSGYAGGFGLLTILSLNVWMFRFVILYCRETREEYRDRLSNAILENEQLKSTINRLELYNRTLEFLDSVKES